LLWVNKYRAVLVDSNEYDCGNVFVQRNSPNAFSSGTFSTYFRRSAKELLGLKLNLQIMRRIFATGVLPNLGTSIDHILNQII
jgi:citrate lyase synthetase